jgi:hypothetical protein
MVSTNGSEEKVMIAYTMSPPVHDSGATPPSASPASIDRLSGTDQMVKARYGVWIQTLKNHPIGIDEGVFLSTFQSGRGQHITALDTGQARRLGERLIALADEIETEVGANQTRRTTE